MHRKCAARGSKLVITAGPRLDIKDGRASVFWQYQGDQQTEDEFWSSF